MNLLGKHCGGVFSPFLGSDALCRYVFASGPGIYEMRSREPRSSLYKEGRSGTTACHTKCGADHIPKQNVLEWLDGLTRGQRLRTTPR